MQPTQTLVGIGEVQVVQGAASFTCLGLGSCVALILSDPQAQVAGVAHLMLPETFSETKNDRPAKFADTGSVFLIERLEQMGGARDRFRAAIVGGAQVIQGTTTQAMLEFGLRNTRAVKEQLDKHGIPCVAEDTGGSSGRTVVFDTKTGKVTVRTPAKGEQLLCRLQ